MLSFTRGICVLFFLGAVTVSAENKNDLGLLLHCKTELKKTSLDIPEVDATDKNYMLGLCYKYAVGFEEDFLAAYQNLNVASERGHIEAKAQLAHLLESGLGTAFDYKRSRELFEESSTAGSIAASYNLALSLPDKVRARELFQYAAINGSWEAQERLGVMNLTGVGGRLDFILGYAWLTLANENGLRQDEALLEELDGVFGESDKEEVKRVLGRLREIIARNKKSRSNTSH